MVTSTSSCFAGANVSNENFVSLQGDVTLITCPDSLTLRPRWVSEFGLHRDCIMALTELLRVGMVKMSSPKGAIHTDCMTRNRDG